MTRRFLKLDPVLEITWPAFEKQIIGSGVPAPAVQIGSANIGLNNTWGAYQAPTNANAPGDNFVACMFCADIVYNTTFIVNSGFAPLYRLMAGAGPSGSERAIAEMMLGHQVGMGSLGNADSGTASVAPAPTATTMTDLTKNWVVNLYAGRFITCGASTATVSSNTTTEITVPSWTGGTPAGGAAYTIGGTVNVQCFMNYANAIRPVLIPAGGRAAFRATTEDSNALAASSIGCGLVGYALANMPRLVDEEKLWRDSERYVAGGLVRPDRDMVFRSCVWPAAGSGVANAGKAIIPSITSTAMSPPVVVIPENLEPYPIIIDGIGISTNPTTAGNQVRATHVEILLSNDAGGDIPYSRAWFLDGGAGISGLGGGWQPLCRRLLVPQGRRVSVRARTGTSSHTNMQLVLTGERVGYADF